MSNCQYTCSEGHSRINFDQLWMQASVALTSWSKGAGKVLPICTTCLMHSSLATMSIRVHPPWLSEFKALLRPKSPNMMRVCMFGTLECACVFVCTCPSTCIYVFLLDPFIWLLVACNADYHLCAYASVRMCAWSFNVIYQSTPVPCRNQFHLASLWSCPTVPCPKWYRLQGKAANKTLHEIDGEASRVASQLELDNWIKSHTDCRLCVSCQQVVSSLSCGSFEGFHAAINFHVWLLICAMVVEYIDVILVAPIFFACE